MTSTDIVSQTIQPREPTNAQDAFVTSIMSIRATTATMMNEASGQTSQPPPPHKQREHHAFHTIQTTNMALFPIPASTFEVWESRFDFPAHPIFLQPLATSRQIRNHDKGFFFIRVPIRTQLGFNGIVLPEAHRPIKVRALAGSRDQRLDRSRAGSLVESEADRYAEHKYGTGHASHMCDTS